MLTLAVLPTIAIVNPDPDFEVQESVPGAPLETLTAILYESPELNWAELEREITTDPVPEPLVGTLALPVTI
jgi:hypothetical protein